MEASLPGIHREFEVHLGYVLKPYLKNKQAGGVAQLVEHHPSKHKALSSNLSTWWGGG
jgi:hypothetical protein